MPRTATESRLGGTGIIGAGAFWRFGHDPRRESTFYQFYPLGLLGAPTYAPAVGDTAAEDAERAQHRILKLADWAPYLDELGVGPLS